MSLMVWSCHPNKTDKNPHELQLVGVRFLCQHGHTSLFAYVYYNIGFLKIQPLSVFCALAFFLLL